VSVLELILSTMVIINSVLLMVLGALVTMIMINLKNMTPAIFEFPKRKPVRDDDSSVDILNQIL